MQVVGGCEGPETNSIVLKSPATDYVAREESGGGLVFFFSSGMSIFFTSITVVLPRHTTRKPWHNYGNVFYFTFNAIGKVL